MRDRETIEREIYRAREDLEASLTELRHAVEEKIDLASRARVAVEKGKQHAEDLFEHGKDTARGLAIRGREGARAVYVRGRETVEERPALVGGIAATVIVVGALIYFARKNGWFRRDEQLT